MERYTSACFLHAGRRALYLRRCNPQQLSDLPEQGHLQGSARLLNLLDLLEPGVTFQCTDGTLRKSLLFAYFCMQGGGLFVYSGGSATLEYCEISSNNARWARARFLEPHVTFQRLNGTLCLCFARRATGYTALLATQC